MKAIIFGNKSEDVRTLVEENKFKIVEQDPEVVITYGGDGTLVKSEEMYPGILKIVLRNSLICKKCSPFSNEEVLK